MIRFIFFLIIGSVVFFILRVVLNVMKGMSSQTGVKKDVRTPPKKQESLDKSNVKEADFEDINNK